jgi:hypothetical protein
MKTLGTFLGSRPWLLVVLAFVLLIAGWVATIRLTGGVPGKHLTADEEASVLKRRAP